MRGTLADVRALPLVLALGAVVGACGGRTRCDESAAALSGCHVMPPGDCNPDEYGVECVADVPPAQPSVPPGCRFFGSPPSGVALLCCPCGM